MVYTKYILQPEDTSINLVYNRYIAVYFSRRESGEDSLLLRKRKRSRASIGIGGEKRRGTCEARAKIKAFVLYTIYVISLSSMYWYILVHTSTNRYMFHIARSEYDMIQGHGKACYSTLRDTTTCTALSRCTGF